MGSQLARFLQHHDWYGSIEALLFNSNLIAFTALLILGSLFILSAIRLGASFFPPIKDDVLGLFSPMVPILVPLAFTGELAYRLHYLLYNVGNFLPILGRQSGIDMEALAFTIPESVIHGVCLAVLAVGVLAGSYVLHIFHQGKIVGSLSKIKNIAVYVLMFLIFLAYIMLF
jgi:hypothetical protein